MVSMEQALPVRSEWLNFNRLRMRVERTVPLGPYNLLLCGKGAREPAACDVRYRNELDPIDCRAEVTHVGSLGHALVQRH